MRTFPAVRRTLSALGALAVVASSVLVAAPANAAPGPDIVLTSPAQGATVTTSWVLLEGYVSDASVDYEYQFDSHPMSSLLLFQGDQISMSVHGLPEGSHTLTITGGGTVVTRDFTIDRTGPVVTVTMPTEGAAVGGSLHLAYTVGDGVSTWVSFDGGAETAILVDPPFSFDMSGMSDGPHRVSVRSVDPYGNSTTITRNFTVDRTAPTVAITMPADGSWIDPAQSFAIMATSNDPGEQFWDLRVDGSTVAGGSGWTPFSYGMPAPTTWADGSTHTISAQARDVVWNEGTPVSITVRADAKKPVVAIDAPSTTLHVGSVVTGTASDTGSGVAQVAVDFRKLRADDTCGGVQFSGVATLAGGTWSLGLPAGAESGEYCLRATATDAVGHSRVAQTQPVVTVDVTGPAAPTGLTPAGELWEAPAALSWSADADAASYEYRLSMSLAGLDVAQILSTTSASVDPQISSAGDWFWQVRGIDALGNVGVWSDPQHLRVIGTPQIQIPCTPLCGVTGDLLELEWTPVADAVSYRVQVSWKGAPGDADDNLGFTYEVVGSTSTTIDLPDEIPGGTIVVRVRAVLDHRVEGTRVGPWSEKERLLRYTALSTPGLLSPANGGYVDGDGVELRWTDDSSAIAWEVRLSTSGALGSDGGLGGDGASSGPLIDPMLVVAFLVLEGGEVPAHLALDEIDQAVGCEELGEFLGELGGEGSALPFPCADGQVTVPSVLADGTYYWQVRPLGFDAFVASEAAGPWSAVGRFTVGDRPVLPVPDTTLPTTGEQAPDAERTEPIADLETEESPTDEAETDEPVEDDGDDTSGGSADAGDGDPQAAAGSDDGDFPLGWIIGGAVALVVIAGGAAGIRMLVIRR